MKLIVLGLNHRSAPVNVREVFSFDKTEISEAINHVYEHEQVAECVLLSTCNRTELYAVLEDVENPKQFMLDLLQHLKGVEDMEVEDDWFFMYEGRDLLAHLFNVASSLDSLVLGEGQILSQLKMAYISAYSRGLTGPIFNIIFQRAISVGKKVRTVTGIANTPVSVSYAAVNLAEDCLTKPMSEAKVLVLGAGEMSELTATHLQSKGVKSIFVSNRTYHKAEALAKRFGGQAISFDSFINQAKEADILITSTGAPHYIIGPEEAAKIAANRQGNPIVMIDIAVPRDIDPDVSQIDDVYLFNIDSLESVVEENKHQRELEAEKAKPIIAEAIDEIEEKLGYLSVRPMMVLLSDKAERTRKRELHRALAKLPDADDRLRKIMDNMSRMIVRKLLRDPMIRFGEVAGKDEENEYWKLFHDMFDLEKERKSL
ncbi:glutamyl-tRNA reductase [Veillonella ratti]|uniref:glutamyl-tRNA reductase n=1 Tax=Veillonella ratti TaxID=103892 RepID=UPI000F8CC7AA|nr:glutamyl-tRNA reductase [Veillonella ratti]